MRNILVVLEDERSASFMLEKALRFSPQKIDLLCSNCFQNGGDVDSISLTVNNIVKEQCETQLIFELKSTKKSRTLELERLLSSSNFEMVILHRPLLGRDLADFSLVKTILRSPTKSMVFLCGDNPWSPKIKVLSTLDIEDESESQMALNKQVFNVAAKTCQQLNAKLCVTSIIPISRFSEELDVVEATEVVSKKGKLAQIKLENFVKEIGNSTDISFHVTAGSPTKKIPSIANKLKADIVVLGNIGRIGIKGLIVGNTAEKILKWLAVDAFIVKR